MLTTLIATVFEVEMLMTGPSCALIPAVLRSYAISKPQQQTWMLKVDATGLTPVKWTDAQSNPGPKCLRNKSGNTKLFPIVSLNLFFSFFFCISLFGLERNINFF